jgi:hypothetical protein
VSGDFRLLCTVGVLATGAQAAAWHVVQPRSTWLLSFTLALAYWATSIASVAALMAISRRSRRAVAPSTPLLALGSLIGGAALYLATSRVEAGGFAIVWSVLVSIESFIVLAGAMQYWRHRGRYRVALEDLTRRRDQLRAERSAISSAISAIRTIAENALAEAHTGAQLASDLLDDDAPRDEIEAVVESRVRSRARSASHAIAGYELPELASVENARGWVSILTVQPSFAVSFALVGGLGLPLVALAEGWMGILVQIAAAMLAWGVAVAVNALCRTRIAAAALIALVAGCLTGTTVVLVSWLGLSTSSLAIAAALTPLCSLVALIPSAWRVGADRDAQRLRALEVEIAQVESAVAEDRERLEQARSELVAALHTTVQGRATAAIVALELGADHDSVHRILTSLGQASFVDDVDPLSAVLSEWRGALQISATVDPGITPEERSRLARHVGEGLLNAARHGQATAVTVSIHREAEYVVLRLDDNGTGPAAEVAPGLGTALAERESGTWRLHARATGGARLEVSLPTEGAARAEG